MLLFLNKGGMLYSVLKWYYRFATGRQNYDAARVEAIRRRCHELLRPPSKFYILMGTDSKAAVSHVDYAYLADCDKYRKYHGMPSGRPPYRKLCLPAQYYSRVSRPPRLQLE